MRLIDADAYKNYICRNCTDVGVNFYGAKDISRCPCGKLLDIEYRPTAYDVDKVVEQLRFYDGIDFCAYVDVVDIVKRGGIDV